MLNAERQTPITDLIIEWKKGSKPAFDELFTTCYQQFKHEVRKQKLKQKRPESISTCIQTTTSIVHDAYLKLASHREQTACSSADIFDLISQVVKSILYDNHRKLNAQKRAPSQESSSNKLSHIDASDLHAKLVLADKSLNAVQGRCSRILHLNLFAGLSPSKIADLIGVSTRTVHNDLKFARAWYLNELNA